MTRAYLRTILCFVFAAAGWRAADSAWASDLERIDNARLVEDGVNDGDSFLVAAGKTEIHVRLYFVDCPESSSGSRDDAQRVREQMRYFGLTDVSQTVQCGEKAKAFVRQALAEPFTVHTAYATAPGRSSRTRVYAFVTTARGEDLAALLVINGLARNVGVGRRTPDDVSRDEMYERLKDLESAAMLKRLGVWAKSNPDRIAELRAEQRKEDAELDRLWKEAGGKQGPPKPIDLNAASIEELQTINGLGPVLAARIVAGRPYKSVDELDAIQGFGPKMLDKLRPHVFVQK
jgi:endonuclease YncB( thermonuclease family)